MDEPCIHCNGHLTENVSRDQLCVWLCGTLWATTPCEQRRAVEAAKALLAVSA